MSPNWRSVTGWSRCGWTVLLAALGLGIGGVLTIVYLRLGSPFWTSGGRR